MEDFNSSQSLWYPDGSVLTTNPDGSISITAPTVWNYLGEDENGVQFQINGATGFDTTVSCQCSSGGGQCNPFSGHGYVGCAIQAPCNSCNGSVKAISDGNTFNVNSGGFVNPTIEACLTKKD